MVLLKLSLFLQVGGERVWLEKVVRGMARKMTGKPYLWWDVMSVDGGCLVTLLGAVDKQQAGAEAYHEAARGSLGRAESCQMARKLGLWCVVSWVASLQVGARSTSFGEYGHAGTVLYKAFGSKDSRFQRRVLALRQHIRVTSGY